MAIRSTKGQRRPARRMARFALLCAIAAAGWAGGAERAVAQDILILRPLTNSATTVEQPNLLFQVEISAFTPILSVKINGTVREVPRAIWVEAELPLTLKRGKNTIMVEVTSEAGGTEKEFEITLRRPGEAAAAPKEEKPAFQVVSVFGVQGITNVLKASASDEEVSGTKLFVVAIPRYDWVLKKDTTLRLQAIVSRDAFEDSALDDEEFAFTQLSGTWIKGDRDGDHWSGGLGFNRLEQTFDTLLRGKTRTQDDIFVVGSMRRGLGKKVFWVASAEIKDQDLTEPAADPDEEEDAIVITLKGSLDMQLPPVAAKFRASLARNDADGRLKDKNVYRLSGQATYPVGNIVTGGGLRIRVNAFDNANPNFDGETPRETLTTLFGNVLYPLRKNLLLSGELLLEQQSSNVSSSEYDNEALTVSLLYIY